MTLIRWRRRHWRALGCGHCQPGHPRRPSRSHPRHRRHRRSHTFQVQPTLLPLAAVPVVPLWWVAGLSTLPLSSAPLPPSPPPPLFSAGPPHPHPHRRATLTHPQMQRHFSQPLWPSSAPQRCPMSLPHLREGPFLPSGAYPASQKGQQAQGQGHQRVRGRGVHPLVRHLRLRCLSVRLQVLRRCLLHRQPLLPPPHPHRDHSQPPSNSKDQHPPPPPRPSPPLRPAASSMPCRPSSSPPHSSTGPSATSTSGWGRASSPRSL